MEIISISKEEYLALKNENELLKDQELLNKMNILIDILFEKKYGLYLGDDTRDLTEALIDNLPEWKTDSEAWDGV